MSAERPDRCETCRFWEPCRSDDGTPNDDTLASEDGGNSGECRARAPLRVLGDCPRSYDDRCKRPDGEYDDGSEWEQTRRVFPLTYCWDWCGEWAEKRKGK